MKTILQFLFLLLVQYICLTSHAQVSEGAPISLQLSAKNLVPNSKLFISGTTFIGKEPVKVTITITNPANKKQIYNVTTNQQGSYSFTYIANEPLGKYEITALGADEKKSETKNFWVASPTLLSETMQTQMERLTETAQKGIEAADKIVNNIPPSAAKDEFEKKSDQLKEELKKENTQYKKLMDELGKFLNVVTPHPELFERTQPHLKEMETIISNAEKAKESFEKRMAESTIKANYCESLNYLAEACSFVSLVLDFKGKIGEKIFNLVSDKVLPGLVDRMSINKTGQELEDVKLKFNSTQKTVLAAFKGYDDLISFMKTGITLDLGQYVAKAVYGKFCTELKGPFTGLFTANFDADGNKGLWNTYEMHSKGTLTLRYEKTGNAEKGFVVKGEFEGVFTKYTFWEDFEKVEKIPPTMALLMRKHLKAMPIDLSSIPITKTPEGKVKTELDINNDIGLFARQLIPGTFIVKVKGKVLQDKLYLEFDKEATINELTTSQSNRLILVLIQALLPIPIVKEFEFPMAPARTIFIVGLNGEQIIDLKKVNKQLIGTKKLNNTRQLDGGIKLNSQLEFKIGG